MRVCWIVPVAAALLLSACGGSDGESDSSGEYPKCADVWVVGKKLPKGYEGCLDDGLQAMASFKCDGGILASFDDRFWVRTPGTINDAGSSGATSTDPAYAAAYEDC